MRATIAWLSALALALGACDSDAPGPDGAAPDGRGPDRTPADAGPAERRDAAALGPDDGAADGGRPAPPSVDAGVGSGPRGSCGEGGEGTGDGFTRVDLGPSHYLVAAPAGAGPHPLVISLHGDGSGARTGAMTTWMAAWRPRRDFLLVAPESPTGGPSWRNGDQQANVDFLIAVLNDVSRRYDVDVNRIYVQGFSGGSTFLGWFGFLFQRVFAGMALHCGGWTLERANYDLPSEACRTPARFVIGEDDFLRPTARGVYEDLRTLGHDVEWVEAGCRGHCCGDQARLVAESLAWFEQRSKCGAPDTGGCGRIDDLP